MIHDVVVPSAGESITEVYIGDWQKHTGDYVEKDDILLEIETQKASFEIRAEHNGVIEVLQPERDAVVQVGDVIAHIDDSAEKPANGSAASSTVKEESKSETTQEQLAQPEVKEETKEKPAQQSSSKPAPKSAPQSTSKSAVAPVTTQASSFSGKINRITKEDFLRARKLPEMGDVVRNGKNGPEIEYEYTVDTSRGERLKPATRIRRQIAKNLVAAQHTAAILTTFNEVDMTALLAFRKKYKEKFKAEYGVPLGIVSFFAMAAKRALKEFPLVNATFTGSDIIHRDFVDISIAVSTDRGLVVPVVKDVDQMNLLAFEKAMLDISERARTGKLGIDEMNGGSFTISNGGVFGSLLSTPIINMPQSAILGLHKTQQRPMVIDGAIAIRPMMYLALSYDHRIVDGKEAVQFLVNVKEGIEDLSLIIDEAEFT